MPPIARPLRSVTLAVNRINCGATELTIRPGGARCTSSGSFSTGGSVFA
jgi:hypothetical protein